MRSKQVDIEEILKSIDISPTMFDYAVKKYKAISDYLSAYGLKADFYPQGSFKLGTVVRPYKEGKETDYDLDVICELDKQKTNTTAANTKSCVGNALKCSAIYDKILLPEDDRCWTLEYAKNQGEIGFLLDIVPCVHQDDETIKSIVQSGVDGVKANSAIAITNRISSSYFWYNSNPNGYFLWFDNINSRFKASSRDNYRKSLFENNRALYASVEDVPETLERTSLQRVIQVLKRHRDVFYTNARKWNHRPISAIITTLSAQIASHTNANMNTYELLQFVVEDLRNYANLLLEKSAGLYENYEARTYIKKEQQKWIIKNPVAPGDNYADSWDNETSELFFKWVNAVYADFINVSEQDEIRYFAGLKNAFGGSSIEKVFPEANARIGATSISGTKPWSVI